MRDGTFARRWSGDLRIRFPAFGPISRGLDCLALNTPTQAVPRCRLGTQADRNEPKCRCRVTKPGDKARPLRACAPCDFWWLGAQVGTEPNWSVRYCRLPTTGVLER